MKRHNCAHTYTLLGQQIYFIFFFFSLCTVFSLLCGGGEKLNTNFFVTTSLKNFFYLIFLQLFTTRFVPKIPDYDYSLSWSVIRNYNNNYKKFSFRIWIDKQMKSIIYSASLSPTPFARQFNTIYLLICWINETRYERDNERVNELVFLYFLLLFNSSRRYNIIYFGSFNKSLSVLPDSPLRSSSSREPLHVAHI